MEGLKMTREKIEEILRGLLVSGNIIKLSWEDMRVIKKELDSIGFKEPVRLEIIKSDFEHVSFRELREG